MGPTSFYHFNASYCKQEIVLLLLCVFVSLNWIRVAEPDFFGKLIWKKIYCQKQPQNSVSWLFKKIGNKLNALNEITRCSLSFCPDCMSGKTLVVELWTQKCLVPVPKQTVFVFLLTILIWCVIWSAACALDRRIVCELCLDHPAAQLAVLNGCVGGWLG